MTKRRWYVGVLAGKSYKAFVWDGSNDPTEKDKLPYNAVIGPFKNKRAAQWAVRYGKNNPHFQTVADAERLCLQEA